MQIMARQVQWTRAARTDKGVHDRWANASASRSVSDFTGLDVSHGTLLRMATSQAVIKGAAAEFTDRINSHLPAHMRVFGQLFVFSRC